MLVAHWPTQTPQPHSQGQRRGSGGAAAPPTSPVVSSTLSGNRREAETLLQLGIHPTVPSPVILRFSRLCGGTAIPLRLRSSDPTLVLARPERPCTDRHVKIANQKEYIRVFMLKLLRTLLWGSRLKELEIARKTMLWEAPTIDKMVTSAVANFHS